MHAIIGKKRTQTQKFLVDGTRIPVTEVEVKDNPVVCIKTQDKDGYVAVQLGYDIKKKPTKAALGHAKKGANLDYAPYFLAEVRLDTDTKAEDLPKVGDKIAVATVLEAGDIINVTGKAKGKGFAGVVKRHHFKGGPRTHGQSDRERAPGSIGQTTTPGRVYRGKRMAGKMGNETTTIQNLEVIDVTADGVVFIKGLIPGRINDTYLFIEKVGKNKKFVAMVKEAASNAVNTEKVVIEQQPVAEEKKEEVKE